MKKYSFFKDRKVLVIGLCLVMVCVFTLTIAYSALSAVLTITGNARVSAADWDIYLNNPIVTNGSATTNVPEIKTSSTLEFSTTLNMPGDFYEFTVDVVNGGDIDAMIENVVKTPDLTTEQAKFLKYEVSYQNGESITTKQLLAKDTTMSIKVRVEYRKDLSNSDLPTGQVVLDLALTLEYVQSDGTGGDVDDGGKIPVELITFTIDGEEYSAEEGMTWGEWVNSNYNTSGYGVHEVGGNFVIAIKDWNEGGYEYRNASIQSALNSADGKIIGNEQVDLIQTVLIAVYDYQEQEEDILANSSLGTNLPSSIAVVHLDDVINSNEHKNDSYRYGGYGYSTATTTDLVAYDFIDVYYD